MFLVQINVNICVCVLRWQPAAYHDRGLHAHPARRSWPSLSSVPHWLPLDCQSPSSGDPAQTALDCQSSSSGDPAPSGQATSRPAPLPHVKTDSDEQRLGSLYQIGRPVQCPRLAWALNCLWSVKFQAGPHRTMRSAGAHQAPRAIAASCFAPFAKRPRGVVCVKSLFLLYYYYFWSGTACTRGNRHTQF